MAEVLEVLTVEHCLLFGSLESIQSHPEMGGKIKPAGKCTPHVLDSHCRGQTLQSPATSNSNPFHIPFYWKFNCNHSHLKRLQAAIQVGYQSKITTGIKLHKLSFEKSELVSLVSSIFPHKNLKPSCRNGGIFPFDHLPQHLILLLQSFVQLLLDLQLLRRLGRRHRARALLGRLRLGVAVAHEKAQALLPGVQILTKMAANQ